MATKSGKDMKKNVNSTTVINLIPPRELWDAIQSIRTLYIDNARCGPHISFVDPFVTVDHFDDAAELLKEELQDFEPFKVKFNTFSHFVHPKSATLFLEPDPESNVQITKLMDRMLKLFPQCNNTIRNGKFTAHVSVAKFNSERELLAFKKKIEDNWKPLEFTLKEIYLLHRDETNPFEVKHVVPLGPFATKPYFGVGSESGFETKLDRTVVFGNLPKNLTDSKFKELVVAEGLEPTAVEVTLNSNGSARPLGVAEFRTRHEAEECVASFKPANGAFAKLLTEMVFPDVIGGSCSLNSVPKI